MSKSTDEHRIGLRETVESFDTRLRLARASELAIAGRFMEAEGLLLPQRGEISATELDLLARIHVRQGNVEKARNYWLRAIEQGSESANYEKCIEVLEEWSQNRQQQAAPGCRIGACVLLLIGGAMIWFLVRNLSKIAL